MEKKYLNSLKLAIIFIIEALMWSYPISPEVPVQGWKIFTIFICTMIGIVTAPMPISSVAITGAAMCSVLGVLSTKQILSGFSEKVVWLLIFSFLIAT